MPGEMGTVDCCYLKLPEVTPEFVAKVITHYVRDISHDEWTSFANNITGPKVFLALFDMCCGVIREISALVRKFVEPQLLASGHNHLIGEPGCRYCRVPEKSIQACFRNSLFHYFREALDVAQESSYILDQIVIMFSEAITQKVNSSLAQFTGSVDIFGSPAVECVLDMISKVEDIFKYILKARKTNKDESCDNLACPEKVEQDSTEESASCMNNLKPAPAPQHFDYSALLLSPDHLINETFLSVLLGKLVDHIAVKTRTSTANVDLAQLVCGVRKRTRGVLNFAPPQSVGSLHISMYKELCWKFRSKYTLQAAMESGDEVFDFAVSETLKSQLEKFKDFEKKLNSFKPESRTAEPDREERSKQTKPSPSNRSLTRMLRKTLSRWVSNVRNFF
ncbi:uncharacterized protein LOC115780908 [Archocentrus centrarchus]|uniref:uncharacterized protein LOC115780908 n=1 Tax=Archocentrus centrarchus TaxID=63155 RepID=UPI0011E9FFF5|nr:uncharacterized protein LOC115780908 [Archocentrus centrarchus]